MRRFLGVVLVTLIAASLYAADGGSFMLGFDAKFLPTWTSVAFSNASPAIVEKMEYQMNFMGFGVFADFKYLRVNAAYEFSIGNPGVNITTNDKVLTNFNDTNGYAQQQINLQVLGKMPIELSDSFSIWPAVGFAYNIVLFSGYKGTNELTNTYGDMNGITALAGLGADIKLFENVYLEPVVLLGWNHMANMFTKSMMEMNFFDMYIDASLGLAFKF